MKTTVYGASDEDGDSYIFADKPERTYLYGKAVWIGSGSIKVKGHAVFPNDKAQKFVLMPLVE